MRISSGALRVVMESSSRPAATWPILCRQPIRSGSWTASSSPTKDAASRSRPATMMILPSLPGLRASRLTTLSVTDSTSAPGHRKAMNFVSSTSTPDPEHLTTLQPASSGMERRKSSWRCTGSSRSALRSQRSKRCGRP